MGSSAEECRSATRATVGEKGGIGSSSVIGGGDGEGRLHPRPWAEFMDWSALSRPSSLGEAVSRIPKNLYYFGPNYLVIYLVGVLFSYPLMILLIKAPTLSLLLGFFSGSYHRNRNNNNNNKTKLFSPLGFTTIFLYVCLRLFVFNTDIKSLFLADLFDVFLDLVVHYKALSVGYLHAIVYLHAAFRVPDHRLRRL